MRQLFSARSLSRLCVAITLYAMNSTPVFLLDLFELATGFAAEARVGVNFLR